MDPKKFRKQYLQCAPDLSKAMEYVQLQLSSLPSSEFKFESNIKPYASVKRKMEVDNVSDPIELSDLVRGRLFFSEQFSFKEIVDIIKRLFGDKVKTIDKKNNKSTEYGLEYCGVVHINLHINGINFELQILPMEFKPHKEFLHQIYERFRNPKESAKMSDKQKAFLRKMHNEIYKAIDKKSKEARHL
ncbi:MAG TPA: hypothetical protein VII94_05885 [Candidatus Saccharimonadales bacterium]